MTHEISKSEFESLLNARFGVDKMFHGTRSLNRRAKTRPYGTYLRSADRDVFNALYLSYCEGREEHLNVQSN